MSFQENFMGVLGGTGVAVLVIAYLGRKLLENRLNKDLQDHLAATRESEDRRKRELDEQASIQAVVKKYSRVVLISATDLQDRLWHLCEKQSRSKNKVLLAEEDEAPMYGSWPMTRKHYLIGTVYFFARYFCWVEVIKENVRFLEFVEDKKSSEFNYHLKRVERMLAETSLQQCSKDRISTDKPLFQLMQSEIGEQIKTEVRGEDQCLSFHTFRLNYEDMIKQNEGIAQLQLLLMGAMSDAKSNFCLRRLKLLCNALADLVLFLHEHNRLALPDQVEKVKVLSFDMVEYEKLWPSEPNNSMISPTSDGG
jgi:hypothetical protein